MLLLLSLIAMWLMAGVTGQFTLLSTPHNTSAVVGTEAILPCVVSGRSNENIQWGVSATSLSWTDISENHKVIHPQNPEHYSVCNNGRLIDNNCTDFSLHILGFTAADQNRYRLQAGGSTYIISVMAVDLPTNLSLSWDQPLPMAGVTNNLTCYASGGSPLPTLKLFKNNEELDLSTARYSSSNNATNTTNERVFGTVTTTLPVILTGADQWSVFRCDLGYSNLDNAHNVSLTVNFNGSGRPVIQGLALVIVVMVPNVLHLS